MRELIILMLLAGMLGSCSKHDGSDPVPPQTGVRVRSLSGNNSHWGDYTMQVKYFRDQVDSILIHNPAGEKIAYVHARQGKDSLTYTYMDLVPNLPQEAIDELIAEYGEEEAKRRIPIVERTYKRIVIGYRSGQILFQNFTDYRPKPQTGDTFDSSYEPELRRHYVYEYDNAGQMTIVRLLEDVYDHEVSQNFFVRTIRKVEVDYYGNSVSGMTILRAEGDPETEENYLPDDQYTFEYNSGALSAVKGTSLNMTYTYSGQYPSAITTNGQTVTYQVNGDGLPTAITYPDGAKLTAGYEEGSGNMKELSPLYDDLFQIPAFR